MCGKFPQLSPRWISAENDFVCFLSEIERLLLSISGVVQAMENRKRDTLRCYRLGAALK